MADDSAERGGSGKQSYGWDPRVTKVGLTGASLCGHYRRQVKADVARIKRAEKRAEEQARSKAKAS